MFGHNELKFPAENCFLWSLGGEFFVTFTLRAAFSARYTEWQGNAKLAKYGKLLPE